MQPVRLARGLRRRSAGKGRFVEFKTMAESCRSRVERVGPGGHGSPVASRCPGRGRSSHEDPWGRMAARPAAELRAFARPNTCPPRTPPPANAIDWRSIGDRVAIGIWDMGYGTVVAAGRGVDWRRSAKLGRDDRPRFVQYSALRQIWNVAGRRSVQRRTEVVLKRDRTSVQTTIIRPLQ